MHQEYKIVRKVVHGVEIDVKVYNIGVSNYLDEEDLDGLLEELGKRPEPTVNKTGMEFYLKQED